MPHFDDPTLLALSSPLGRPLHFLGLELVVLACFALTLRHALAARKSGALFQWMVIFAYGVLIELLAFNYYQNYEHGQFTVQLYHRKLPLYVTAIYVVFHYTGLKLVERLRLPAVQEALLAGLAIALVDVPFDIVGPAAGWWRWSDADRNLAHRWLGVPVTSFYWYLLFGAVLAGLSRLLARRMAARPLWLQAAIAPLVGAAIIVIGTIAFLPLHGLVALGVPDGAVVAAHALGCAVVAWRARPAPEAGAPRALLAIPAAIYAWHAVVLALVWQRLAHAEVAVAAIAACAVGLGLLLLPGEAAHFLRARRALD